MAEQSNLQRVFETILSSQSFELLSGFSSDDSWESLSVDERDLLAQLFLLSAEANAQVGDSEEIRNRSTKAYRTACRLIPNSARNWYRLGAYQALSGQDTELQEAIASLKRAVELDAGFFDAHYALGCAQLRFGALKNEDTVLIEADISFARAETLVVAPEGSLAPIDFYWHWGIVWFLRAKASGEPIDLKKCLELFEKAQQKGLGRSNFLNDYGNAIVEMALLTSNDSIILDAIAMYSAAIEASESTVELGYEKAIRFFNVGCCYQHLYDLSHELQYFEQAEQSFSHAAKLGSELPVVWQRWGLLLFQAFRFNPSTSLAQEVIHKFQAAEEKMAPTPTMLALSAQATLWMGREQDSFDTLAKAEQLVSKAMDLEADGHSPEVWAASALCQYEYGYYFQDQRYFDSALTILQKGLAEHPKSALLWHILALVKVAESENTESEKTLREALVSYHLASRSTYAHMPSFWNDWGIALLTLADETDDQAVAREAITKFEVARELDPRILSPWVYNLARALDVLGGISDDEEPYLTAIDILTELVSHDPSCTFALQQLAMSYLHLGETREKPDDFCSSTHLFEQYFELESEDEFAWSDYALALMYIGSEKKEDEALPQEWFSAEEALLRSLSLGNDQAYYYLASLYSLMGNFSEAMQYLYQAFDRQALPPLQAICEDPWFEPMSKTVVFSAFIDRVKELGRLEDQTASE